VKGHVAGHPRVANICKFDYIKRAISGIVDVFAVPFISKDMIRFIWCVCITSEARTPIKSEVPILLDTTHIERIASLEVVWEEVRIIYIYSPDYIFVWWLPIQRVVALEALRAYLINDYLNSLRKYFVKTIGQYIPNEMSDSRVTCGTDVCFSLDPGKADIYIQN